MSPPLPLRRMAALALPQGPAAQARRIQAPPSLHHQRRSVLPRFVTLASLVTLVTVVSRCYKGEITRGAQDPRLACPSFSDTKMQSKLPERGDAATYPSHQRCCAP